MRGLTFSALIEIDVLEWNTRLFHFNTRPSTRLILPIHLCKKNIPRYWINFLFQISRFLIVGVVMDNTSKIVMIFTIWISFKIIF